MMEANSWSRMVGEVRWLCYACLAAPASNLCGLIVALSTDQTRYASHHSSHQPACRWPQLDKSLVLCSIGSLVTPYRTSSECRLG